MLKKCEPVESVDKIKKLVLGTIVTSVVGIMTNRHRLSDHAADNDLPLSPGQVCRQTQTGE